MFKASGFLLVTGTRTCKCSSGRSHTATFNVILCRPRRPTAMGATMNGGDDGQAGRLQGLSHAVQRGAGPGPQQGAVSVDDDDEHETDEQQGLLRNWWGSWNVGQDRRAAAASAHRSECLDRRAPHFACTPAQQPPAPLCAPLL
jgi:hypothetical protein